MNCINPLSPRLDHRGLLRSRRMNGKTSLVVAVEEWSGAHLSNINTLGKTYYKKLNQMDKGEAKTTQCSLYPLLNIWKITIHTQFPSTLGS